MTRVNTALALGCATLLGCPAEDGGDPGSSEDRGIQESPGGFNSSSRLCDAHLAWDKSCAALEPEPREDPYWGETECLMGPWHNVQAAYLDAATECFDTLSCDEADDACTAAGLAAIGIDSAADIEGDPLLQRCQELAASCEELNDDSCLAFAIYTDQSRDAAELCLDLTCDSIEACLVDPG